MCPRCHSDRNDRRHDHAEDYAAGCRRTSQLQLPLDTTIVIARSAPVITALRVQRTGTGFDVT